MERIYRVKKSGDDAKSSDPKLIAKLSGSLPILYLTGNFIDRYKIEETDTIFNNSPNSVYLEDANNTELDVLAEVFSANRNENLLLVDSTKNRLTIFNGVNDFVPDHFANNQIYVHAYDVGGTSLHYGSGETITLPTSTNMGKFSYTKSVNNLSKAKKYTLTLPGMRIGSMIDDVRYTGSGIKENVTILTILELDVDELQLDTKELTLYTIYSSDFFRNKLRIIGRNLDVNKIHIPLI